MHPRAKPIDCCCRTWLFAFHQFPKQFAYLLFRSGQRLAPGGRGAIDFITRATIGLGVTFFITSLALALMTSNASLKPAKSLIQEQAKKAQTAAPQVPSAPIANPAGGAAPQGGAVKSAIPAKGSH